MATPRRTQSANGIAADGNGAGPTRESPARTERRAATPSPTQESPAPLLKSPLKDVTRASREHSGLPPAPHSPGAAQPSGRLIAVHVFLFVCACLLAAAVLWAVERPKELDDRDAAQNAEDDIEDGFARIIADYEARGAWDMADAAIQLRREVRDSCELGIESQFYWSFAGALYFVSTVVTTIGYGSFAPQTTAGKVLTCFIAIVGIAWFGFILAACSKSLMRLAFELDRRLRCRPAGTRSHPRKIFCTVLGINLVYICLVTFLGTFLLRITWGNAAYMAIITFTTVGLGDFSPPFIYHDTTYLDVCLQYLCFAFASLIGLVGLSLLVHALDEWVVTKLAQGLNLVSWRWCHVLARSRIGRSVSSLELSSFRGRTRQRESPSGEQMIPSGAERSPLHE